MPTNRTMVAVECAWPTGGWVIKSLIKLSGINITEGEIYCNLMSLFRAMTAQSVKTIIQTGHPSSHTARRLEFLSPLRPDPVWSELCAEAKSRQPFQRSTDTKTAWLFKNAVPFLCTLLRNSENFTFTCLWSVACCAMFFHSHHLSVRAHASITVLHHWQWLVFHFILWPFLHAYEISSLPSLDLLLAAAEQMAWLQQAYPLYPLYPLYPQINRNIFAIDIYNSFCSVSSLMSFVLFGFCNLVFCFSQRFTKLVIVTLYIRIWRETIRTSLRLPVILN